MRVISESTAFATQKLRFRGAMAALLKGKSLAIGNEFSPM
jgi:hypothetical protein